MFTEMQVIFMNTCFVFYRVFFFFFSTTISTEHQTLHHIKVSFIRSWYPARALHQGLYSSASGRAFVAWLPWSSCSHQPLPPYHASGSPPSKLLGWCCCPHLPGPGGHSAWLDISSSSNCADSMQPSPWSPACQAAVFLCPEGTDICFLGCQSHSPLSFWPFRVYSWTVFHHWACGVLRRVSSAMSWGGKHRLQLWNMALACHPWVEVHLVAFQESNSLWLPSTLRHWRLWHLMLIRWTQHPPIWICSLHLPGRRGWWSGIPCSCKKGSQLS